MAERKRNRLKLKVKKTNSDASVPCDAKTPNKEPISNLMPVGPKTINTYSVSNVDSDKQNVDVIHIIDDDISVITESVADRPIHQPKIDSKLLGLQQKLSKFSLPVCDVWKLDDLPPYIEKTKRTPNCQICTEELLPLPKLSMEYLTSKRPNYSFTGDSSEQSNYDEDIAYKGNTSKRKMSDDFESVSKRKKIGDFDSSIAECPEVKNEKVIDKPYTSENLSCIPNNSTKLCPICSATFPFSLNQMEIDGHIASCLSLADDDDVNW